MMLEEGTDELCVFSLCAGCEDLRLLPRKDGWNRMEISLAKEKETASEEVDDFMAKRP